MEVEDLEKFENSLEKSNIEIEEMECVMVSDDSIFNHLEGHNEYESEKKNRRSDKPRKMRKSKDYLETFHNDKENFTMLNNISSLNNISKISNISFQSKESPTSSEKKKLYI